MSGSPIPVPEHIAAAVRKLAEKRREAMAANEAMASRERQFQEQHAAAIKLRGEANTAVKAADQELRELLVAHYNATKKASPEGVGDKSPLPGVGVKVGTSYEFDEAKAIAFAQEKQMCLLPVSLDRKGFLELCKVDSLRPDFVKVIEVPGPAIATDLTAALEAIAAAPVMPETEEEDDEAEGEAVPEEAPATAGDVA